MSYVSWFDRDYYEERDRLFSKYQPNCHVCAHGQITPDKRWCWCDPIGKWSKGGQICHNYDWFEPTEDYEGWFEWIGENDEDRW